MQAPRITAREQDVLDLLGQHLTHAEIADRLFLSVRTVESHAASLRRKLDLPDHRSLVRYAAEHRRLPPAPTVPLTSFVGRNAEIAEIAEQFAARRLISIVGPGGAGKTRLALAVLTGLERMPWRTRMVELARLSSDTELQQLLADACGAAVSSRRGPLESLILALRDDATLLLLDNAEHVVNAVAVMVDALVTACPHLRILVTSRVRLALPYEYVLPLAGLAADDAMALFLDRAGGAGLRETVDPARVEAICRAVDGLALAVELAAARLPVIGVDGVERGLLDQSLLLTAGAGVTGRQRSMTETLEWSSSLLDEPARVTLRRIAVLAGPFDLATAATVAGFSPLVEDDVAAAVAQLVEHSMLVRTTRDGRTAYAMLEPIRQFAERTLTTGDEPVRLRHLRWCLTALSPLLDDPDPRGGLTDVDADIRAALGWAAGRHLAEAASLGQAYALLLFRSGRLREAQDRYESAGDFAAAAAVAKCRVLGEDALRLELAETETSSGRRAALALIRAAELVTRFAGMFTTPMPDPRAEAWLDQARAAAPGDDVAAAVAVAEAATRAGDGLAALERARAAGDVLLESAAMDAACGDLIVAGDLAGARKLAVARVARLLTRQFDPAGGLELKDALHTGVFCALGAGDLDLATDFARRQGELAFLREQRDLADEELLAPAALSGDWDTVLATSRRFLADWTDAGRPVAPGRGLSPAAVALAHGLRDERGPRQDWLAVLARMRGVPLADASIGSGYGELFDAMVLLHDGQPRLALEVLRQGEQRGGFYVCVFRQWFAGFAAEAAALAGEDAGEIDRARGMVTGNPIAMSALARAEAAAGRRDG